MADAVKTNLIFETQELYVVRLSGISDGTGETAAVKVDKSTLLASDGAEPASLDVLRLEVACATFSTLRLFWDHTVDDLIFAAPLLAGLPYLDCVRDYRIPGLPNGGRGLKDPRSAGDTGDIILTSSATSGGIYEILLWLYKAPD